MPKGERSVRIASSPSTLRPCSGMVTIAMLTPSANGLEEELQDLDVTLGLVERDAPRIQPVASNKERVRRRVLAKPNADVAGKPLHVLVVVDDRHKFPMIVGRDAGEALEHLVALDRQATRAGMEI